MKKKTRPSSSDVIATITTAVGTISSISPFKLFVMFSAMDAMIGALIDPHKAPRTHCQSATPAKQQKATISSTYTNTSMAPSVHGA